MRIRLATEDDVAPMLEICNYTALTSPANFAYEAEPLPMWQATFASTRERYPWIVAFDDDTVLGYSKAGPWKARAAYAWTCELSVYVHRDHQGRGIGRALYSRLFPTLEAQGYRTLFAGITTPNPPSVRLHESFGMKQCALMDSSGFKFGAWHNVAYWQIHLGHGAPGPIKPVADVWQPQSLHAVAP